MYKIVAGAIGVDHWFFASVQAHWLRPDRAANKLELIQRLISQVDGATSSPIKFRIEKGEVGAKLSKERPQRERVYGEDLRIPKYRFTSSFDSVFPFIGFLSRQDERINLRLNQQRGKDGLVFTGVCLYLLEGLRFYHDEAGAGERKLELVNRPILLIQFRNALPDLMPVLSSQAETSSASERRSFLELAQAKLGSKGKAARVEGSGSADFSRRYTILYRLFSDSLRFARRLTTDAAFQRQLAEEAGVYVHGLDAVASDAVPALAVPAARDAESLTLRRLERELSDMRDTMRQMQERQFQQSQQLQSQNAVMGSIWTAVSNLSMALSTMSPADMTGGLTVTEQLGQYRQRLDRHSRLFATRHDDYKGKYRDLLNRFARLKEMVTVFSQQLLVLMTHGLSGSNGIAAAGTTGGVNEASGSEAGAADSVPSGAMSNGNAPNGLSLLLQAAQKRGREDVNYDDEDDSEGYSGVPFQGVQSTDRPWHSGSPDRRPPKKRAKNGRKQK